MRDAVAVFMAMATQWRWVGAGMAGAFQVGLDYSVLDRTALALKVELTPAVFNDIRLLELETLKVWSKRRHG